DGAWWCLESNPVPTFLPYEVQAGLPIADAVLDWMERNAARSPAPTPRSGHRTPPPRDVAPNSK
ncbi:MAG TPA: hypothetical protein VLA43_04200, partial [Longimicrobiales bacterium]|nr:hypothetical protein [Longimicrobiales bacterium]